MTEPSSPVQYLSRREYEKFCDQKSARRMRKNCNCIVSGYAREDAKSLIKCNSYVVVVSAKNSFAPRVAAKFSRQSEQVNEESGARVVSY
jgi:hypothetical protein